MAKEGEELKQEHKIFAQNYIYDWNASRSYKVAYPGVTDETARVNGCKLLTNANIQAYISEIQKDLEKIAGISRLRIAQEHLNIINTSIGHLHNTWIERKEFDKLTDTQKSCIAQIETQTRVEMKYDPILEDQVPIQVDFVKLKLYDKQKAFDSLAKMFGYDASKKIEHIIPEGQIFIIGGQKIEF